MAALAKLSPERRQVFIDAAIDGKSYQQVADEQGVKIGTVMSRLNRAARNSSVSSPRMRKSAGT